MKRKLEETVNQKTDDTIVKKTDKQRSTIESSVIVNNCTNISKINNHHTCISAYLKTICMISAANTVNKNAIVYISVDVFLLC